MFAILQMFTEMIYLNYVSSCQNKHKFYMKKFQYQIIKRKNMNFQQLASRLASRKNFDELYNKQIKFLDIKPFNIQKVYPDAAKKLYIQTKSRYQSEVQLKQAQNSWHQNQRRVFVWYMTVFLYQNNIIPIQLALIDFSYLSSIFFSKNPKFLEFQYLNLVRIPYKLVWTEQEDNTLLKAISEQKKGKWNQISKRIFYQSNFKLFRSPKHCRQRWFNHLDKSKQKGEWTLSQEYHLLKAIVRYGKRWSKIAATISNKRTEHMIKNRYYALLNKNRRSKKQIEQEVVIKIFEQISKTYKQQKIKQRLEKQNLPQIHNQKIKQQKNNIKKQNIEQDYRTQISKLNFSLINKTKNQNCQECKIETDSNNIMREQNTNTLEMPSSFQKCQENVYRGQQMFDFSSAFPYWMYYIPSMIQNFQLYEANMQQQAFIYNKEQL